MTDCRLVVAWQLTRRTEDRVITQQLRKVGNSYVVTVPKEEVERRGWHEGQLLALQLTAARGAASSR